MWGKIGTKRKCNECGYSLRWFDFITLGIILHELFHEKPSITRATFYRRVREGKIPFPPISKSSGGWRVFSREGANQIKDLIKKDLKI